MKLLFQVIVINVGKHIEFFGIVENTQVQHMYSALNKPRGEYEDITSECLKNQRYR